MKLSTVYNTFIAASFSTLSTAMIWLDPLPSIMQAGDTHRLNWTTDHDYDLEMLLVKQESGGWSSQETLFKDKYQDSGNGSKLWSVPFKYGSDGRYGIWLSGMNVPDDQGGYANLTNWFQIAGPLDKHDRRAWPAWQIAVAAVILSAVVVSTIAGIVLVVMRKRHAAHLSRMSQLMQQEDAMVSADSLVGQKNADMPGNRPCGT